MNGRKKMKKKTTHSYDVIRPLIFALAVCVQTDTHRDDFPIFGRMM